MKITISSPEIGSTFTMTGSAAAFGCPDGGALLYENYGLPEQKVTAFSSLKEAQDYYKRKYG